MGTLVFSGLIATTILLNSLGPKVSPGSLCCLVCVVVLAIKIVYGQEPCLGVVKGCRISIPHDELMWEPTTMTF